MRITEILTESQLEQLDEGPLGSIGSAIGKGVGGLAKGVGAVAGGIAGIGRAAKKGYEVGKATVAGDPVPDQEPPDSRVAPAAQTRTAPAPAPTAAAPAPAAAAPDPTAKGGGVAAQPAATDVNKAGPTGTAPAQNLTGAAKTAADRTAAVTKTQNANQAGQTMYAQVKANIDKLDKKGKQRILQLLQKSLTQPAPAAGPGSKTAGTTPAGQPRVEPDLNAPAGGKTAPAAPTSAEPVKGKQKKAAPAAAPSQAEIDADRQRLMGPGSESKLNKNAALAETLSSRIEQHKKKMFETGIASGEISVFAK